MTYSHVRCDVFCDVTCSHVRCGVFSRVIWRILMRDLTYSHPWRRFWSNTYYDYQVSSHTYKDCGLAYFAACVAVCCSVCCRVCCSVLQCVLHPLNNAEQGRWPIGTVEEIVDVIHMMTTKFRHTHTKIVDSCILRIWSLVTRMRRSWVNIYYDSQVVSHTWGYIYVCNICESTISSV